MTFQVNNLTRGVYIDVYSDRSKQDFYQSFTHFLTQKVDRDTEIVILCIGTDRATGDSLGPLIGYKLKQLEEEYPNIKVLGTLDSPVHGKNLSETVKEIYENSNPFVIAIDACLGSVEHIGCISTGLGGICPGAGVGKTMPPVGDIFVRGIVNFSGSMEIFILQNTRLNLVIKMAEVICHGLIYGLKHLNSLNTPGMLNCP